MSKLRKQAPKVVEVELEEVEVAEVELEEVGDKVEVVEVVEDVTVEEAPEELNVFDNAVKNSEAVVETVVEAKVEPKVRINPKQDIRTFIGDQWYNLQAGKQVSVPRTVKDKLQKAGLLSPL